MPRLGFKYYSLFIFTSLILQSASIAHAGNSKVVTFYKIMPTGNKKIPVELTRINQILFSKSCVEPKRLCQAKLALDQKVESKKTQNALAGNPASQYCLAVNGKSIILRDAKNRQYDFCEFPDSSLVDSWGLYQSR